VSVYDYRDRSAYRPWRADASFAKNAHIAKWWSSKQDLTLRNCVESHQWGWPWHIREEIEAITSPEVIENWRREDPVCSSSAWYNVLMYFAIARANALGLDNLVRSPQWKVCPLCDNRFVEDSLPEPLVRRLGVNQIDFCSPCLAGTLFAMSDQASREEVLQYIRDLAEVTGRIPPQDFGSGEYDIRDLTTIERLAVLGVLRRKPSTEHVKNLFDSWFAALVASGVLSSDAQRMSRGIRSLASDGHVCLSLGERTIDDFLSVRGIPHEKEPKYPDGQHRADFLVGDIFIEYLGLAGDPDYDAKTILKERMCRKSGRTLLLVFPRDLASASSLKKRLSAVIEDPESS
jgi:hypothetical protein